MGRSFGFMGIIIILLMKGFSFSKMFTYNQSRRNDHAAALIDLS